MLHALGWPPWRLALLIEIEAGIVGLAAGLIAPAIAYLVITRLNVGIQPASPLLAAPLAVVVALIAALVPAMMAARVRPVDAMSERGRVRRSRPLWSAVSLGARNLLHAWGAEAAAAVAGLWLAAVLVGILLLLVVGFRGQLDTSVLGITLAEHVAPYHVALIAITVVIGLLGAAEVLTLSYLERRPQLALLRALGWPRPAIAGLIIGEGAVIAAAAAVAAVVTVVAIGFGLGASPVVMALASIAAVATAIVITFTALLIPTLMGFAIDPAQGLHRT
jgi:ABC-type antimicrobial peptide transport system permease subunit